MNEGTGKIMRPINAWAIEEEPQITHLFTDLDETVTSHGILQAKVYRAMEDLAAAGVAIIVVTGRPAGWCDLIARLWPVAGAIAESGGLAMRYHQGRMHRLYWQADNRISRLKELQEEALRRFSFARLATDNRYREVDIAFDHAEENHLSAEQIKDLEDFFRAHGAEVAISSIHLHAWFGNFNKYKMAEKALEEWFGKKIEPDSPYLFVGDSLNDASMFAHFPKTIGVANIKKVAAHLPRLPDYVTRGEAGEGFLELANMLLRHR